MIRQGVMATKARPLVTSAPAATEHAPSRQEPARSGRSKRMVDLPTHKRNRRAPEHPPRRPAAFVDQSAGEAPTISPRETARAAVTLSRPELLGRQLALVPPGRPRLASSPGAPPSP